MADVQCTQFEFACNTVTGNQTILSNTGYTIKGYILISFQNTSNATFQIHSNVIMGFSDGTTSACTSANSQDNVTTSNAARGHINQVLEFRSQTDPFGTRDGLADHSSFGTGDDIVINWSDAPSSAWKVYGLAFGGADFECEVGQFAAGRTTAGNQSYTTTMANPEFGIFMTTVSTSTPSSYGDHGTFGMGVAFTTTKEGALSGDSEDARPTSDTWQFFDDTWTATAHDGSSGGIAGSAEGWAAQFVSWDANGWTWEFTEAPASVSTVFYAMVMKTAGLNLFDVGIVAKRTSTGTTTINPTGVGQIVGLMLFSDCANSSTSVNAHARYSMGVASSASLEGGGWTGDQDAAGITITAKRSEDSNILMMADEADTVGSSTVLAIANVTVMGENTFTLDYTTADATAAEIIWWVIGNGVTTAAAEGVAEAKRAFGKPMYESYTNPHVTQTIFGY